MAHTGDNYYTFDDIKFGGAGSYPKNTFAGMKIYGVTLAHNPGEVTKLTIRCVEAGTIPKTAFPAAVENLKTDVADREYDVTMAGVKLPQLFLQKIEKNTSVSQKTLTLTFVDGSILLDKIFVGLVNQHASNNDIEVFDTAATNYALLRDDLSALRIDSPGFPMGGWASPALAAPTDPAPMAGTPILSRLVNFSMLLNCEPCYENVINSLMGFGGASNTPSFVQRGFNALRVIDYGAIVDVDHRYGGKIILGQEQFCESAGDLPNVDYNFTELLGALAEAGIDCHNFTDINPAYRKNYTGTLREVLGYWAADFGFMHYWDFQKKSSDSEVVKCIFLTNAANPATTSISELKAKINSPDDGIGYDSIMESEDMSGTKNVSFQIYYKKPAKPRSFQRRIQYRQIYQPLDPYTIFPRSINGDRSKIEFDTSCALAKFNKNARTLYNFYFTNAVANRNTAHLGIRILEEIPGADMKEVLNEDFSCQQWEQIFDRYADDAIGLANTKGYLAVYSKQEERKWESWEAGVADMYGKYYVSEEQNDYMNFCGVTEKWEMEAQHQPAGQKIKGNDFGDLPFNNLILNHPAGRGALTRSYAGFAQGNLGAVSQQDRMFTVFQRNAPWGTDQSQFEGAFVHSGVDFLEKLVPTYIPLNGKSKIRFFDRIKEALSDQVQAARIESKTTSASRDAQVILLLAPPTNFLGNNFVIQNQFWSPHMHDIMSPNGAVPPFIGFGLGGWNNPNEYKEKDDRALLAPCAETYYEKDIKKEGCACPTVYGWSPSGAAVSPGNPMGVVPIITQDEDIELGEGLAPRPGIHLASAEFGGAARGWYGGGKYVYPWADWGARNWSLASTLGMSQAHVDLMKPFFRDEQQEELYVKYGTNLWPLADKSYWTTNAAGVPYLQGPSMESRYAIHLCAGFRIKSYAPGYTEVVGNSPTFVNPYNSTPGSTAPVGANVPQNFYDPTGSGFMGPPVTVDIIYPSQNWYEGVRHVQASYMKTERGAKQVRGTIGDASTAQAIEVNSVDITSDMDTLSNPEGNSVIQIPVPVGVASSAGFGFRQVSIDDYYNEQRLALENVTIVEPRKTLSFRQIGASPLLSSYMDPSKGLDNFNVVLDQDGTYIDWSFSTRPVQLPKPDVFSRKLGPSMNMNVIR